MYLFFEKNTISLWAESSSPFWPMETRPVTTIRIFLASSNELKKDRDMFAAFIMRLNKHYDPRGFKFVLEIWDFIDPAYNNKRKQDEYNGIIRKCDYFVALFHTKAGKYTVEELKVAREECKNRHMPLFIYFRDLDYWQALQQKDKNLEEVKQYLGDDLEHFWGGYNNNDKLHLDFVLWLDNKLNQNSAIKVDGDDVKVGDLPVAQLSQLPFAANNNEFQRLYEQLTTLEKDIEELRQDVAEYPENRKFSSRLSQKMIAHEALQLEVQRQQEALLGAAKRIAELRKLQVSEKLARAAEALENGHRDVAMAYLNQLQKEGDSLYKDIASKHEQMFDHIEALRLQTQTIMADTNISIEKRTTQIIAIYKKADIWSIASNYDEKKYNQLLIEYARFLYDYAYYREAEEIYLRQINHSKILYGEENLIIADSYNNIGLVYKSFSRYDKALEYFYKALNIFEQLDSNNPSLAISYNGIGAVYHKKADYDKALEYYNRAFNHRKLFLGEKHADTAKALNNIGTVYYRKGEYDKALEYYKIALAIKCSVLGNMHRSIAISYNNIGETYDKIGNKNLALDYYNKALTIREQVLGKEHPSTAFSYDDIGIYFKAINKYAKAFRFCSKALAIRKHVYGLNHPEVAISYIHIGDVYLSHRNYYMALDCYQKALDICENVLGIDHPDTATSYNNIGLAYYEQGLFVEHSRYFKTAKVSYEKALNYINKALYIREKVLGKKHLDTAMSYNNIGAIYENQGNYSLALEFYEKCLSIFRSILGNEHLKTKLLQNKIYKILILIDHQKDLEQTQELL